MAEGIVQKVLHLKERLLGVSDSNKVLKLLKKLQDLNITVDILVETGIGKTVNGFRKNDAVGDLAKELVSQWKKLIPQETSRDRSKQNEKKNNEHSSLEKKDTNKSPGPSRQEEILHATDAIKSAKLLSEEGNPKKRERSAFNQCLKIDSDQLKTNECQLFRMDRKECCQVASKNNLTHHQESLKFQIHEKSKSLHKVQSNFSRKDKKSTDVRQKKKSNEDQSKKESSLEIVFTSSSVNQENPHSAKDTQENGQEQLNKAVGITKHGKSASKVQKSSSKDKEIRVSDKSQGMSRMTKKSTKVCKVEDVSEFENEEFEKPTMSFESYLNYEEPKRNAKRPHTNKNSSSSGKDKDSKLVSTTKNESIGDLSKESKKRKNMDRRDQNEEDIWLKTSNKKGKIDINTLLDIPLPKFLPDVADMPSDSPPTSPIKKSMSSVPESTMEFTGRRLNCKMQVYSGSKTTNIMKMMSLYEQCIRVLQNNIDSIHEVGGVPFEIIEPVLGRCTPEQLFRIEECNPSFIEQTSHFWMKHCKKDFKNEEPQEFESWRELYLRLYDEREQKLKILTQSISSAHANKPKGRQVKLAYVNTSAKPPRNILRQQGKHGTSCSALLNSPFGKNKKKFVAGTGHSSFGANACSDRPKANNGCVTPNCYSGPDAKKQVKKVAPMMAKSLRAFKNRLGPR
ncbi:elongin A, like isoform X2 [Chiloscyllium plagiosum]|uniref:elongin A, like isoform X2 n=1 Tax=Chiloscyllium plagiosum TaxID=36176 RepID=UPI001CB7B37C|nr:elongin A, like isoform X2 [Chiloscyllium plagiosum]